MSVLNQLPPDFPPDQVAALVDDLYGLRGTLTPLNSERDQNFRLACADGSAWVVKIANAVEDRAALDFQAMLLAHAAEMDPGLPLPTLRATRDGQFLGQCAARGKTHFVRMVTYLPGVPFAEGARDAASIAALGTMLGRLAIALRGFSHAGAIRALDWDLVQAGKSRARLSFVADPAQREILDYFLARFERIIAPALKRSRVQVIHGDANDYNVLVADTGSAEVTGIIDFGDAILSPLINEVAVAAAYAAMGRPAPIDDVAALAAAFHRVNPLLPEELDMLFDLVALRLVISVTMSAARRERVKDNAYLAISEAPAWNLLERLRAMDPVIATAILRQACGFEAAPGARGVVAWLHANRHRFAPVLDRPAAQHTLAPVPFGDPAHPIAIASAGRQPALAEKAWEDMAGLTTLGLGRWGEERAVYTSEGFRSKFAEGEARSLHLGLDLFRPAGTRVRTPLPGRVADIYATDTPLDYGHAILLAHEAGPGQQFYSLWGHLSAASAAAVTIGQELAAGDVVGWMGDHHENGGWQCHVHLQLVAYPPACAADVIGAGETRYREVWAELYPDAADFAGLPPEAFARNGRERDELLARRRERLIGNLSISYARPLKIVRGAGVHLYDDTGRAYLDCYNNVAQLGHANPEIVEIQARQAARLNTNTRYLHDNIIAYAEALCATLPPALTVAAFVCSGSEANDLALRMARAHTGRRGTVALDWAYHGHLSSLIEISPYKYKRKGGAGRPADTAEAALPDSYRAPDGWPRAEIGRRYAQSVAEAASRLASEGHPAAAFIAESLPSSAGQIVLPAGYLPEAYRLARAAGAVVIADEVQIGFGRVGDGMWGFGGEGAAPDIVTMGKPIGNGHPMAALVTTREIAESFNNGMEYFNTFGGNPVSCAIGLKVLEILERDRLLENARVIGADLLARMTRLKEKNDIIGDVRGRGLMLGIELVEDRHTKAPAREAAASLVDFCRREGVLLGTDGPHDNVIKMRPAMIFRPQDADLLMEVLEAGFAGLG